MGEDDSTSVNTIPEHETDHDRLRRIDQTQRYHGKQLNKIQGDIRWAIRIVLGALILAVLSLVLAKPSSTQSQAQTTGHTSHVAPQPFPPSTVVASSLSPAE